jgi:hypothetical protein
VGQQQSYWKRRNSRRSLDRRLLSAEIRRSLGLIPFSCTQPSGSRLLEGKFNFNCYSDNVQRFSPLLGRYVSCVHDIGAVRVTNAVRTRIHLTSIVLVDGLSVTRWKIHRKVELKLAADFPVSIDKIPLLSSITRLVN